MGFGPAEEREYVLTGVSNVRESDVGQRSIANDHVVQENEERTKSSEGVMESDYEMKFRARGEGEGGAGCNCHPKRPGTYLNCSKQGLAQRLRVGVMSVPEISYVHLSSGKY